MHPRYHRAGLEPRQRVHARHRRGEPGNQYPEQKVHEQWRALHAAVRSTEEERRAYQELVSTLAAKVELQRYRQEEEERFKKYLERAGGPRSQMS